jgi:hypothetical protein
MIFSLIFVVEDITFTINTQMVNEGMACLSVWVELPEMKKGEV